MPTPSASQEPSQPEADPAKGDRIAKLLARAGIASRREIERMIDERRIALDGTPLETPATILTSLVGITVDGKPVAAPEPARLFVYHKPPGLLVTERDPAGRATIYDRLPADLPRTVPVGRLDLATEGLLLLTTDGGLKRTLELPATGVERTYRARAYGNVTQAMLEELIEGIEIEGVRYGPIDANLERRTGANVWIELTLTEGKNREVRRVLEFLGLEVSRLIRTRYGPFVLGDLPPGEVGEVTARDLANFTRTLGGARRPKGADLASIVTVEARGKGSAVSATRPEAQGRPPRPVPPPATSPARPRISTAAVGAPGGWGSRTRPSRPAEAADAQPRRGAFRLADEPRDRPARDGGGNGPGRRSPSADPASHGGRVGRFAVESERPRTQGRRPGDNGRATSPDQAGASARAGAPGRRTPTSSRHPGEGRGPETPPRQGGKPPSSQTARPHNYSGERTDSGVRRVDGRAERNATSSRSTSPPRAGKGPAGSASSAKPAKGPAGGRGHPPRPPKGKPRGKR